jgi:hypothetical protein
MTTRPTFRIARMLTGVLALACLSTIDGFAQDAQVRLPEHHAAPDRQPSSDFVNVVREATARFRDVSVAEAEGYTLMFGCVSGPDWGAMGLHYVNLALVGDGVLDPARPEIVIYEPLPNGRVRLIGADYLVFAGAWHATNQATPQLGGQLLHFFESPNRFGLPDFYTLHVWAWKDNPTGTYVNWHSKVSCDAFSGRGQ